MTTISLNQSKPKIKRLCSIDGCNKQHEGHGWCQKHYTRFRRTGSTDKPKPRLCTVDGCDEKHYAKGLCQTHYSWLARYGDPLHVGGHARGESNGRSKLTEQDIIAIRADTRLQREIADEYGIDQSCIGRIKRRLAWKHVQ